MAKGITIGVASDTRDFAKGIKNGIIEPLEDADDTLKDLERAGERSGESLEDSMKDAQRATERYGDDLDELKDQLRRTGRGGRDMGDDMRRGTREAGDGMDELKDEANSTAREAAASFDGSAESISDAFQEVAANAFAGFGPAGAAAGLAVAAGLGIAQQALQSSADEANEAKQKVGELALEIIDAGGKIENVDIAGKMRDWGVEIADNKEWWEVWQDEAKSNLDEVRDATERTGIAAEDMFAAMSGYDSEKAVDVINELKDQQEDLADQLDGAADAQLGQIKDEIIARQETIEQIKERTGLTEDAIEDAEDLAKATEAQAAADEKAQEAAETKADVMESVADAYDTVRDAAIDAATSDDGIFNIDQWMEYVAEHKKAVEQYKENLGEMELTPEQWENYLALPENARQAIAQSWADGDDATREAITKTLTDAGSNAGSQAAVKFDESFNPDADAEVVVDADTSAAEKGIAKVSDAKYEAVIDVKAKTKTAQDDIESAADFDYSATIDVGADLGDATTMINNWKNKKRYTYVTVVAVDEDGKKVY